MAVEIERKFLVKPDFWDDSQDLANSSFIQQAYLSVDPERVVRIRISDNRAFITIKGIQNGLSRKEFEYTIPFDEAIEMLSLAVSSVITKRRIRMIFGKTLWEIDRFFDENEGLILAEVELKTEADKPDLPPWIGKEVSHDPRYSNLSLSLFPYSKWEKG